MHKRYMDLEKRCKKYYMKIYTRYAFVVIALLLAVAIVFLGFFNNEKEEVIATQKEVVTPVVKEEKKPLKDINLEEKPVETIDAKLVEKPQAKEQSVDEVQPQEIVKKEMVDFGELVKKDIVFNQTVHRLEPVYSFEIDELLQNLLEKEQNQSKIVDDIKEQPKSTQPQTLKEEKVVEKTPPLVQRGLIQAQDIESIEQKIAIFNQRPHYDRAYGIAYDYFVKQEYEEAIVWLQKADSLNGAQEKVFELYAKSLYKLGRNTQAINLLDYYLQLKVSNRLETLKRLIQQESE